MRRGPIVTLAVVCGLGVAAASDGRAALPGCPPPQTIASALRTMNLSAADWGALTPAKIRDGWQQLLNQVECADRPSGIYLLSSFGRIINDESLCATSFTIEYDRGKQREWLGKVSVFHTAAAFREAHAAADLIASVWHPGAVADLIEEGMDDWRRAVTRPARAETQSRWPARLAGCQTTLQLQREIYPSRSGGWTVKVSLAPESVCETK